MVASAAIHAVLALRRGGSRGEAARSFQRATGGVGLGPSVSVGWSVFAFDPRAERACENELWPVPGLTCPSPAHGAVAIDPPPRP